MRKIDAPVIEEIWSHRSRQIEITEERKEKNEIPLQRKGVWQGKKEAVLIKIKLGTFNYVCPDL